MSGAVDKVPRKCLQLFLLGQTKKETITDTKSCRESTRHRRQKLRRPFCLWTDEKTTTIIGTRLWREVYPTPVTPTLLSAWYSRNKIAIGTKLCLALLIRLRENALECGPLVMRPQDSEGRGSNNNKMEIRCKWSERPVDWADSD